MSRAEPERNIFICKNLFGFIPLCRWHGNCGAATSEPELELSESAGREEQHFRGALVWIVRSFSGEFKRFHQSQSFSLAFLLLIFCCSSGSASVISRKPQKKSFFVCSSEQLWFCVTDSGTCETWWGCVHDDKGFGHKHRSISFIFRQNSTSNSIIFWL